MADKKSTNGVAKRKAELERLRDVNERVRRELEELYRANAPGKDDSRAEALKIAHELDDEIRRCVHALKANDGAAEAEGKLRRMRRALHRVVTDQHVAPSRLIPVLHAVRRMMSTAKGFKGSPAVTVLREMPYVSDELSSWTDAQVLSVIEAKNFNQAMAQALGQHGHAMTAKNVGRIVENRKTP